MVIRSKFLGRKEPGPAPGTSIRISNPWHAVSVEGGRGGCPAAQRLAGQRFLSGQAPKLPLVSCSNPMGCHCVYKHHDDRRAGPRRILDNGKSLRSSVAFIGDERRGSHGRRATDG